MTSNSDSKMVLIELTMPTIVGQTVPKIQKFNLYHRGEEKADEEEDEDENLIRIPENDRNMNAAFWPTTKVNGDTTTLNIRWKTLHNMEESDNDRIEWLIPVVNYDFATSYKYSSNGGDQNFSYWL